MLHFLKNCFDLNNNWKSNKKNEGKNSNRQSRSMHLENCEERVLLTVSPLTADLPDIQPIDYSTIDYGQNLSTPDALVVNMPEDLARGGYAPNLEAQNPKGQENLTPMNAVTLEDNVYTFGAIGDTATIGGITFTAETGGSTITVDNETTPITITITSGSFALSGTGTVAIDDGQSATIGGITFTAETADSTITVTESDTLATITITEGTFSVTGTLTKHVELIDSDSITTWDVIVPEDREDTPSTYLIIGDNAYTGGTYTSDETTDCTVYSRIKSDVLYPESTLGVTFTGEGNTFYNDDEEGLSIIGTGAKTDTVSLISVDGTGYDDRTIELSGVVLTVGSVIYDTTEFLHNEIIFTYPDGEIEFTDGSDQLTINDGSRYSIKTNSIKDEYNIDFSGVDYGTTYKYWTSNGLDHVRYVLTSPTTGIEITASRPASASQIEIEPVDNGTAVIFDVSELISFTYGSVTYYIQELDSPASLETDKWYDVINKINIATLPLPKITSTSTSETITVSWNEVPEATGYTCEYKKTDGTIWNTATVSPESIGDSTVYTAVGSDLDPDTPYDFRVKATGVKGEIPIESNWSEIEEKTLTSNPALGAPTDFTATPLGNQVTLNWTPVTDNTYIVEYKLNNDTEWTQFTGTTTEGTALVTGLSANTSYDFRIQAKKDTNVSGYTTLHSVATKKDLATPTISASEITANSVIISWAKDSSREPEYTLEYSYESNTWTVNNATNGGIITGLTPNTPYEFKVIATKQGYTTQEATKTVLTLLNSPTEFTASVNGSDASLSWNEVTNATGYTCEWSSNGTTWYGTTENDIVSATTATITNLTGGPDYYFRVRANATDPENISAWVYNNPAPTGDSVTVNGLTFTPGEGGSATRDGSTVTITGPVTVTETGTYTGGVSVIKGTDADLDGSLSLDNTETFKVGDTTYTNVSGTTNLTITDSTPSVASYTGAYNDGTTTYSHVAQTVNGVKFTPPTDGTDPEIQITGNSVVVASGAWTVSGKPNGGNVSVTITAPATLSGEVNLDTTNTINGYYTVMNGSVEKTGKVTFSGTTDAPSGVYTTDGTTVNVTANSSYNLNGLIFTPGTDGSVVINTTNSTATATGACTVSGTAKGDVTMSGSGLNSVDDGLDPVDDSIGADANVTLTIGGTTYTEKGTDVDKLTVVNGKLGAVTDGVFQVGSNSYIINSGDSITIGDRTFSAGAADAYITITDSNNVEVTQGDLIVGNCTTAIGTLTVTGGTAVLDNGANVGSISGTATTAALDNTDKVTVGEKEYTDAYPDGNSTITFGNSAVTSYTGAYNDGTTTYSHVAQMVKGVTFTPPTSGADPEIQITGDSVVVASGKWTLSGSPTGGAVSTTVTSGTLAGSVDLNKDNAFTYGEASYKTVGVYAGTLSFSGTTGAPSGVYTTDNGTTVNVTANSSYNLNGLIFTPKTGGSVVINTTNSTAKATGACIVSGTATGNVTMSGNGLYTDVGTPITVKDVNDDDDVIKVTFDSGAYSAKGDDDDTLSIKNGAPTITAGVFQVDDGDTNNYQFVNGTTTINGVIYTGTGTVTNTGVITSGSFDVYCATTGAKTVYVGDTTSTISINNTDPTKAITVTSDKALTLGDGEAVTVTKGAFTVSGTGGVTIENASSATIGGVTVTATVVEESPRSATLTIEDNKITEVVDGDATLTGGTIANLYVSHDGSATLSNTVVSSLTGSNITTSGGGTFNVDEDSVSVDANNVVELNDATVTVTNGKLVTSGVGMVELTAAVCTNGDAIYSGTGTVLFWTDTETEAEKKGVDVNGNDGGNVAITNGQSEMEYTLGCKGDSLTYNDTTNGTTTTYTAGPLYNDEGYPVCATLTRNDNVVTGTGNYYVGNTYYVSNKDGLADAIAKVNDGSIDTITLLEDITIPAAGTTAITGTCTINDGGFAITGKDLAVDATGKVTVGNVVYVANETATLDMETAGTPYISSGSFDVYTKEATDSTVYVGDTTSTISINNTDPTKAITVTSGKALTLGDGEAVTVTEGDFTVSGGSVTVDAAEGKTASVTVASGESVTNLTVTDGSATVSGTVTNLEVGTNADEVTVSGTATNMAIASDKNVTLNAGVRFDSIEGAGKATFTTTSTGDSDFVTKGTTTYKAIDLDSSTPPTAEIEFTATGFEVTKGAFSENTTTLILNNGESYTTGGITYKADNGTGSTLDTKISLGYSPATAEVTQGKAVITGSNTSLAISTNGGTVQIGDGTSTTSVGVVTGPATVMNNVTLTLKAGSALSYCGYTFMAGTSDTGFTTEDHAISIAGPATVTDDTAVTNAAVAITVTSGTTTITDAITVENSSIETKTDGNVVINAAVKGNVTIGSGTANVVNADISGTLAINGGETSYTAGTITTFNVAGGRVNLEAANANNIALSSGTVNVNENCAGTITASGASSISIASDKTATAITTTNTTGTVAITGTATATVTTLTANGTTSVSEDVTVSSASGTGSVTNAGDLKVEAGKNLATLINNGTAAISGTVDTSLTGSGTVTVSGAEFTPGDDAVKVVTESVVNLNGSTTVSVSSGTLATTGDGMVTLANDTGIKEDGLTFVSSAADSTVTVNNLEYSATGTVVATGVPSANVTVTPSTALNGSTITLDSEKTFNTFTKYDTYSATATCTEGAWVYTGAYEDTTNTYINQNTDPVTLNDVKYAANASGVVVTTASNTMTAGTATISGTSLTVTGGAVTVAASTTMGTLDVDSPATAAISGTVTASLTGSGTVTVGGAKFTPGDGAVMVETAGVVNLNDSTTVSVSDGTLATTGDGTVTVAKTKALTSGGSTFTSEADGSKLKIDGTDYTVTAGSFAITNTNHGKFTLTAGSTLSYCGYTFTAGVDGAIFETSGTNAISIYGAATVTDDTEVTNVAVAITVTSGTTAINTPISVPVSSITTSGSGAVTANNTATIAGNVTIGGSGASSFGAAINGAVTITGGTTNNFTSAGAVTISGGSATNAFSGDVASVTVDTITVEGVQTINTTKNSFTAAVTGAVDISSGTSTTIGDATTDTVGGNVTISGGATNTINSAVGTTATPSVVSISGGTTNDFNGAITGSVTASAGKSTFSAGVTDNDTAPVEEITISATADVTFDGGNYVATKVDGGTLNISTSGTIASLDLNGGTTTYNSGTITGNVALDNAKLNVAANLANTVAISDGNTDATINFTATAKIDAVTATVGTVNVTEAEDKVGTIGSYTNSGAASTVAAAITGTAGTTVVSVFSGSATFNDAITGNVSVTGGNFNTGVDGDITGTLSIDTTSTTSNTLAGDVSGKVTITKGTNVFNGALNSSDQDIDLDIDGGTNTFTAAVAGDVDISGGTSNTFAAGATVSGKVSISAGTSTFSGALNSVTGTAADATNADLTITGGKNSFIAAVAGHVYINDTTDTGTTTFDTGATIAKDVTIAEGKNKFNEMISGNVTISGGNTTEAGKADYNIFTDDITGTVTISDGTNTFHTGNLGDVVISGGTTNIGIATDNAGTIASLDINGGVVNYYGSGAIGGNDAAKFTLSTGTMNLYGNLTDSLTLDSEGVIKYKFDTETEKFDNTITNKTGTTNTLTFTNSSLDSLSGGEVTFVGTDKFTITNAAKVNYDTDNSVTNVTDTNTLTFDGSDLTTINGGTATVTNTDNSIFVTNATVRITDTSKSVTVAGTVTLDATSSSITELGTGETVTINAGAFNVATTAGEDGNVVVKNNTTAAASATLDLSDGLTAKVPGGDMTFTFNSSENTITLTANSTVTADMVIPAGVELITGENKLTAFNDVTISVKGAITTASPEQLNTTGTGKFVFEAGNASKLIINQTEYIGNGGAVVITGGTLDVQTSDGGGFSATLSGTSPAVTIQKGNGLMFGPGLDADIFYMGTNDKLDVTNGTLKIVAPVDCTGTIVPGTVPGTDPANITLDDNSYLIYGDDLLQEYFTNEELTLIKRSTDGRYGYYPNLQIALNNANSVEDVIMLTCDIDMSEKYQSLIVTKPVTINGKKETASGNSPNYCLTGNGTQPIFDVDANGLVLRLQDLDLTKGYSEDVGGAIRNYSDSILKLENVNISNSEAIYGGGIYTRGEMTITGACNFSGNEASRAGGAIYADATVKIDGEIKGKLYTEGQLTQYSIQFNGNKASEAGAAIYTSGSLTLTESSVLNQNGSAVYINGTGTFQNVDFLFNNGSALYVDGGTTTLNGNVVFAGNKAENGAGVYLFSGTLETANPIAPTDPTVEPTDPPTLPTETQFFPFNEEKSIGALYTAYSAQFIGNESSVGGAVYIQGTATLDDVYMAYNTAKLGGAAYVWSGELTSKGTYTYNYASNMGGAVYSEAGLTLTGSTIEYNWAGDNYGDYYAPASADVESGPNLVINAAAKKGIVYNYDKGADDSQLVALVAGIGAEQYSDTVDSNSNYVLYTWAQLDAKDDDGNFILSDETLTASRNKNAVLAAKYLATNTGVDCLKEDAGAFNETYLIDDLSQYVSPTDDQWLDSTSNWTFKGESEADRSFVKKVFESSSAAACDFDSNMVVDMADFIHFAQSFNQLSSASESAAQSDLDGNGKVDMADFIVFAAQFNQKIKELGVDTAPVAAPAAAAPVAVEAASVAVEAAPVAVEAAPVAVEAAPVAVEAAPIAVEAVPVAAPAPVVAIDDTDEESAVEEETLSDRSILLESAAPVALSAARIDAVLTNDENDLFDSILDSLEDSSDETRKDYDFDLNSGLSD